jgi:hypothetical protein
MRCSMVLVAIRACHMRSFPTAIVTEMAPFEALCGRKCRTPLFWNQTGESQVFGPDVLRDAEEQVRMIRNNLKVA